MTIGRIPSVEGGIQPTIVDAKGDLIAGVAADSVNRLAVGSNDQVLVADSSTSTGLAWKPYAAQFVAGKNVILNGDFNIWQRGTSISVGGAWTYTTDRWRSYMASGTATVSRQAFTPGTAPVAGYEGIYFMRHTAPASGGQLHFRQSIENVQTFAGQTVTLSFWAKASTNLTLNARFGQYFGSGGSADVTTADVGHSITTSWTRFTQTVSIPSISGKTIGANNLVEPYFTTAASFTSSATLDIWGVQVEAGSVATPFTTATGTIQGELAACSRYYYRVDSANANDTRMQVLTMAVSSTTISYGNYIFPVRMRTSPSFAASTASGFAINRGATTCTAVGQERSSVYSSMVRGTVASGLTVGQADWLEVNGNNTAYIEFSAEL